MTTDVTLIILGLSMVMPLFVRPMRRIFLAISVSSVVVLLINLMVRTGDEWLGGSGILRGIPRIFTLKTADSNAIFSWTALELLILLGILFYQLGTYNNRKASFIDHVTYVSILVLALANTLWLISITFTIIVITGLHTSMLSSRDLQLVGRTATAYWITLMSAILGFSVISGIIGLNQGYGVLFSPEGYGGVLDQSSLAVIRHATFSFLRIVSVKYILVAPILMGSTLIAFSRVIERSTLHIRTCCSTIAVLLGLKLFPILELGLSYAHGLLLILFGFATISWSVLSDDESSTNIKTVVLGGAFLLIGAKSPVGAVFWVLLWLPGFLRHEYLRVPGLLVSLMAIVILNIQLFEHIPLEPGVLMGIVSIATIAIGVTYARSYRSHRYHTDGFVPLIILSLITISSSMRDWPLWGDKLEISFKTFPLSAFILVPSLSIGWILSQYFGNSLRRIADQTVVVMAKAIWTAVVQWIIPLVDITAVIWVALERFLWQGLTLFGPRRILNHVSEIIGWFDSRILNSMRWIPGHIINALDFISKRIIRFPAIIILIVSLCIIFWNLRGVLR